MIRIRISADAVSDLNAGFWFYEAQQPGLGEYFAASLRADIEGLRLTGGFGRGQAVSRRSRRWRRGQGHLEVRLRGHIWNQDRLVARRRGKVLSRSGTRAWNLPRRPARESGPDARYDPLGSALR